MKQYITRQEVKNHLYIDHNGDDDYIDSLIQVAHDAVKVDLDVKDLSDLEAGGVFPQSVRHAMLLLIGTLYANRESVSFAKGEIVPHTYNYLLDLYRKYNQ